MLCKTLRRTKFIQTDNVNAHFINEYMNYDMSSVYMDDIPETRKSSEIMYSTK